ncbi:hypothetical protein [Methanolobus psychrotolerans]|uniref:hypothetical protein n=1 Tax=Methanolobus psychrotolerans TaxID=1874706 RepID=UPI000B91578A|nr:hypothetical protein [Methanolobus psychrotolerans]
MALLLTEAEYARLRDHIKLGDRISCSTKKRHTGGRTRKSIPYKNSHPSSVVKSKDFGRRDIAYEEEKWVSTMVRCQVRNGRAYVQSGIVVSNNIIAISSPLGEVSPDEQPPVSY